MNYSGAWLQWEPTTTGYHWPSHPSLQIWNAPEMGMLSRPNFCQVCLTWCKTWGLRTVGFATLLGPIENKLVGGFNPSEKYWSMGRIIPHIMENTKCSKPTTSKHYILPFYCQLAPQSQPAAQTCRGKWCAGRKTDKSQTYESFNCARSHRYLPMDRVPI